MAIKKQICSLLFILGTTTAGISQEILTVQEAVKIALENNYQIKTARNELAIDSLGATLGHAGILPRVGANLSDNNSIQHLSQTRSNGTFLEEDNVKNSNFNYGVDLQWTVFDGLRMFANHEQLKANQKLGEAALKQAILASVGEVLITYYDLVQQHQQLEALDSTLIISHQRVELAQNRFTIGKASKLEVLNAQVDLNTDQTLMQRQQERYKNTKIRLNQQLARDLKLEFSVIPEIFVDRDLHLEELEERVARENPQLEAERINKRISELELKQIKAARYPTVFVNSGYNIGSSESGLGFATTSES